MEKRWQRGDTVIVRYPPEDRMVRCYQEVTGDHVVHVVGWPHVVLDDTTQRVAVYMPEGTSLQKWDLGPGRARPSRISQGESVRLFFPGKRFEVTMFYETGSGPAPWVRYLFPDVVTDRFYGWKVDLTSPFGRGEAGFDMIDETLDIVIGPDRTYRWKDEDQMARFVELGLYTVAEADELRKIGQGVIEMAIAREPPFDEEWATWRPDPDLVLGDLPEGWQFLPVSSPYVPYSGPLGGA